MNLWLRCQDRVLMEPPTGRRWRGRVEVGSEKGSIGISPKYEPMCAAIDDAIHARYLHAVLDDIVEVEANRVDVVEEETEAWQFWIRTDAVTFEGKFDQGSGKVTLTQFKLAVSAFRDFLNDPERKPVEIPFPDA